MPLASAFTLTAGGIAAQEGSSTLPLVIIDTQGLEIPADDKITASMKIIFNHAGGNNSLGDAPSDYDGKIGIEIRGQSSASPSVGAQHYWGLYLALEKIKRGTQRRGGDGV